MRALIIISILLLVILQYPLWIDRNGISKQFHLKRQIAAQMKKNAHLYQQNHQLVASVKNLTDDQDAVEGIARSKMGMVRKGETYYQVM